MSGRALRTLTDFFPGPGRPEDFKHGNNYRKLPHVGEKQRVVLEFQRECSVLRLEMASSEPLQSIWPSFTVILFSFKNWRVSESTQGWRISKKRFTNILVSVKKQGDYKETFYGFLPSLNI